MPVFSYYLLLACYSYLAFAFGLLARADYQAPVASASSQPGSSMGAGKWAGEVREGDGRAAQGEGSWQLPYLADENADEDPELKVAANSDAAAQRLREAFLAQAKQVRPDAGEHRAQHLLFLGLQRAARHDGHGVFILAGVRSRSACGYIP